MSDCELIPTCPFFNDYFQEISEPNTNFKEEYCYENYEWCGRYIIFKRIEADKKLTEKSMVAVSGIKDNHEGQRLARATKLAI